MGLLSAIGMLAGGAAIGVGGAALVLPVLGFTAAGIAAGSIAAGVQSTIGNVVAGSTFALLQSAGVVGTAASTKVALGAAGAAAGAAIGALI